MNSDVEMCARCILRDLAGRWFPRCLDDLWEMCERHGVPVIHDWSMQAREGGKFVDDSIVLSPFCSFSQYLEVVFHEMVHALQNAERWSDMNGWLLERHDRKAFVEAVARRVGQLARVRDTGLGRWSEVSRVRIMAGPWAGMIGSCAELERHRVRVRLGVPPGMEWVELPRRAVRLLRPYERLAAVGKRVRVRS